MYFVDEVVHGLLVVEGVQVEVELVLADEVVRRD